MLKHLAMIWLVICAAGYGTVWAFDGHSNEIAQHQDHAGHVHHAPDGEGNHPACDHCCHASAHIIALWPALSATANPGACTGQTPYRLTLSFNTTSPPDRPPQD